jgi:hypothetical protein
MSALHRPGRLAIQLQQQLVDIWNTLSIEDVMKNEPLYQGNTLNDLWPRQRAFPPLRFQHEEAGITPTVQP